jgi:LPXTG-motif cell wall-anchored protein
MLIDRPGQHGSGCAGGMSIKSKQLQRAPFSFRLEIVGGILPGLMLAGGGLLVWRRRKRRAVAAA